MPKLLTPIRWPLGTHFFNDTLVIPQHRADMGPGVPAPASRPDLPNVLPAGRLQGQDARGTVLCFPGVKGAFIQTEYYNTGLAGNFWQSGQQYPKDTKMKAVLSASVCDVSINGCTVVGKDSNYAHGLCMQGSGHEVRRVKLWQIPGTALRILGGAEGPTEQGGPWSMYDEWSSHIEWIKIDGAYKGVEFTISDSSATHVHIDGCVTDGIVFGSSGGMLSNSHVGGCDRAFVFTYPCKAHLLYADGCRIGVHIKADNVEINGLELGGVNYERGVIVDGNCASITDLTGRVYGDRNPPATVVECARSRVGHYIRGQIIVSGNETGLDFNYNHRSEVNLRGNCGGQSTFVKVRGYKDDKGRGYAPQTNRMDLSGLVDGGTYLDLSESNLNVASGGGSVYRLWIGGQGGLVIKYPGYGTPANPNNKFNLIPGTRVYINDELQGNGKK